MGEYWKKGAEHISSTLAQHLHPRQTTWLCWDSTLGKSMKKRVLIVRSNFDTSIADMVSGNCGKGNAQKRTHEPSILVYI